MTKVNKQIKLLANEPTLFIVGEPDSGKTSLINRLLRDEYVQTNPTTKLKIENWVIPTHSNLSIKIKVWEFGKDEYEFKTHKLFFIDYAIYVIVINFDDEKSFEKSEYWLKLITKHSPNSSVFLVMNKIDLSNHNPPIINFDFASLKRNFPETLKEICIVSCDTSKRKHTKNFKLLSKKLIEEIKNHLQGQKKYAEEWFSLIEKLYGFGSLNKNYIYYEEFNYICNNSNIESTDSHKIWDEVLHENGIAYNYSNIKKLGKDLAVINPEWICQGIHSLLHNSKIAVEKGLLKKEELNDYLDRNNYPPKTHNFIISVMQEYELLYEIENNEKFLIPNLIPTLEPDTGDWNNASCFQYIYKTYNKSIIKKIIIDFQGYCSNSTFWENGLVLKLDDNRALIFADSQKATISIKVDGNPFTRQDFGTIISNKINEINKMYQELEVEFQTENFFYFLPTQLPVDLTQNEIEEMVKGKQLETTSENLTSLVEILFGIGVIALAYFKSDEVIDQWKNGNFEPVSFLYTVPYLLGIILILFGIFRRQISLEILDKWLFNIINGVNFKVNESDRKEYCEICNKFKISQKNAETRAH